MRKEAVREVKLSLTKIFLTPPKGKRERLTLLAVMVIVFMIFFGPIVFTEIHPIKAVLLSALPALSMSWGWIVLLRFLFHKGEYCQ